jgi:predicted ATPase
MRRCAESLRQQDLLNFDGLFKIALAEAEARAGNRDRAIATLDEALATADRLGYRAFEAELNRTRGEILLECDPAKPAPAEEAFHTAIAVAQQQGARSFGLRAALSLAKLYQLTARPADAHAVLAPALEGFAPTPEMPEIAEARTLLAALAGTDDVKAAEAHRQRRAQLQVAYGNALIAARGFGAPETTEAFTRVREAAFGEQDAPERLAADFGLWAGSYTRGELPSMRTHAADFLADVAARPDSPEAGVAHRAQGVTHWFAGEFPLARDHLERALALFQSGRDDDLAFRFGMDPGVPAMIYLGLTLWILGETDRAVSLIERARQRVASLAHAHTLALGTMQAAFFELMRGDRSRARTDASQLSRIVREHDLRLFRAFGEFLEGWLTADSGALGEGLEGMRRGAENLREQNALVLDGLIKMALSELEARGGKPERALAVLDEALATAERLGFRAFEAELHRARGELLFKQNPADPAPAEEALLVAIGVAHRQGALSFGLLASLSLAKLYQSTCRPADAHAALAPALDGFAPTPEMPEIAEAQALLERLA